jgi:tRNA-specific 2-thiouridylase
MKKKIKSLLRATLSKKKNITEKSQKPVRGLVLFSGGLDSILAAKILQKQGIKVVGLTFKSYFFGAEQAKRAAKELNIPLKVIDFSKKHLEIVKKPKHGYGKGMNPCIDCHTLMLKTAKRFAEQRRTKRGITRKRFNFVVTGEVLGERPMSQNRQALELIEKESSLKGYLLRPLSAKLLKPTVPEERGWVDRGKLFAISGRSRKKQMALAKKWRIKKYPTPAGGCLLTDLEFSKKLKELLKRYPKAGGNDIELLKTGRHRWINNVKMIIGRNHEENLKLKKLFQKKDILIELKDFTGPTTLIRNYGREKISESAIKKAKELTKYYSTKARNKKRVEFKINS